jgi:hypothetical protein
MTDTETDHFLVYRTGRWIVVETEPDLEYWFEVSNRAKVLHHDFIWGIALRGDTDAENAAKLATEYLSRERAIAGLAAMPVCAVPCQRGPYAIHTPL